jgi:predicted TPR repeat methyltransferase
MPPTCCSPDYDAIFDERAARRELADYRRRGATGTTRRLVDAIRAAGVAGATVLDIGGGVGVIGAELLTAGASSMTDVDVSRAYVAAARDEVERRGFGDRATFRIGDFVQAAPDVEAADIVTLDRVICCYGGWMPLVDASTQRARRLYGLVYPRDRWWTRFVVGAQNAVMRLLRRPFRFYVHPERQVDARIRAAGFEPVLEERGLVWQTLLYRRIGEPAAG